jgi:hypothetical protein
MNGLSPGLENAVILSEAKNPCIGFPHEIQRSFGRSGDLMMTISNKGSFQEMLQ